MKYTLKFNAPYIVIIFIFLYLTNLSLDVSQWREDQATQLWLGYTFKLSDLPIGLISSQEIPNPNGNIVLAKFIGLFPKFINSLFVYILLQAFLLLFFVKSLKIKKVYLSYIVFCILIFNTYFLFSATELWSQYLMVSLNFLVLGYIFFKIDHSHSINVLNAINLVLLLPSVYLGGFLNAFCLLIIFSYLVIFHKLRIYLKLNIFNVSVFLFLITYIWLPYFQNIEFSSLFLSSSNSESSLDLSNIIKNLIFNNIDEPYIIQSDHQIFPQNLLMTRTLIIMLNFSFNIVFLFCLCVLFINSIFKKPTKKISYKSKVLFVYYYSNILISPLIGGPNFLKNERLDIELQFYFIYLIAVILLFLETIDTISFTNYKKLINIIFKIFLISFVSLNIIYSFLLQRTYLEYDGDLLSNSDIPLEYKMQAIDFIVSDAKNNGNLKNSTLNIYYDLIGEKYKLEDFGTDYPDFYNAPYTIGRIFDVILLKDFGIKNYQEGIQIRSTKDVNYIITYKFHTRVDVAKLSIKEYKDFNRFRVFVIDN